MNQVSPRSIATLRRILAALLLAAGVLLAPRAALAALPCGVLDQVSPAPCNGYYYVNSPSSLIWQQQIRTGKAGQLLGISIPVVGSIGDTLDVSIRKGTAPSIQPPIFQQLVTLTDPSFEPWIFVDMQTANLSFAVGEIFVMEIHGSTNPDFRLRGTPFYPEPLYRNGSILPGATLGFATYVTPSGTAQCEDDLNPCTTDTCNVVTGMCVHVNNALPCDDGNLCTQNDVCNAGACVSGAPVTCAALDVCHTAGVCNPMTGQCTNPGKPLDCSAKSVCEQDGFCDLASAACLNPAKPDGVPCGQGFCLAGTCSDKAGNTTSGGTSTTGSASTSTGTSTGVGGAGAGGAGAGGPGATATGSGEEPVTAGGGCGCSMPGTSPVRAPWVLLGLLLPAWRRRRQAPRLAA